MTKTCSRCGQVKELERFPVYGRNRDGRYSHCRTCHNKACQKSRRSSPTYHRRAMLYGAKSRAKKSGVPFDLTLSDIVIPETCPVLGIPIEHQKGKHQGPNSPTIDRLFPELGYVKSNVIIVSLKANRIKNDATLEELEAVTKFYRNRLK